MGRRRVKRAAQDPVADHVPDDEEARRWLRARSWKASSIEFWEHPRRPGVRFSLHAALVAQKRSDGPGPLAAVSTDD
jgi:hypothetical protein